MWWNVSLETGIHILDKQHKELFRQVDDVLLDGDNKNRIAETLDFLERYVLDHFKVEELMQERLGYPKRDVHKKQHEEFALALPGLRQEYSEQGYAFSTVMKINKISVDWLKNHIMKFDMEFATYVKCMKSRTHDP